MGQCKKYGKPIGTNVLQQFEGMLSRTVPHSYHNTQQSNNNNTTLTSNPSHAILGIIVSGSGFSKAAASYFMSGVSCILSFLISSITADLSKKYPLIVCNIDQESISYFSPNLIAQKMLPLLVVGSKYLYSNILFSLLLIDIGTGM